MDVRIIQENNYVAIRRLSPLVDPPDDWPICMLTAYLDGSASDGLVGLASYIATQADWAVFERQWSGMERNTRP